MASTAADNIRVLYATNRIRLPVGSAEIYEADGRTGDLLLGSCSISLVGGPGLSGAGLPHEVNEGDWTSGVQGKEVLVFVHGYNNTFTSAVQGAARLQVDIPFKEGLVVAFSWASWGKGDKYVEDGVIQGWSIEPFLKLLGLLKLAAKIHILAHSMGNRIALQALARLVSPSAPVTLPFGQLIFAAADENSDVFARTMTHLVQANLGEGRTVYASCQDGALWASAHLHRDNRAGQVWPKVLLGGDSLPYQSRRPYVLVSGLDTIDCTDARIGNVGLDSHGYFAQKPVISDIAQVLEGKGPASPERAGPAYGRLTRVQPSNDNAPQQLVETLERLFDKRPRPDGDPVWWRLNPKTIPPAPNVAAV